MADELKLAIPDLPSGTLTEDSVFETAIPVGGGLYSSNKVSTSDIADIAVTTKTYSGLNTNYKTPQGAINELNNKIDTIPSYDLYAGTLGSSGQTATLPLPTSINKGKWYNVVTSGTYSSQPAIVGDIFISTGTSWQYIPTGGGGMIPVPTTSDVNKFMVVESDGQGGAEYGLKSMPDPLVPRGTLGTNTGDLPDLPNDPAVGDTYFVATDGTYGGISAHVGDMFYYNADSTWSYVPTGDVDTWRNIYVNGTEVQGIDNKDALKFVNGTKINVAYDITNKTVAFNTTDFELTSILTAGQTTLTFTDARILATSKVNVYAPIWYISNTQSAGSVVLTFPTLASDISVTIIVH